MATYKARIIKGLESYNDGSVECFNSYIDFGYVNDGVTGTEIDILLKNYRNVNANLTSTTYIGMNSLDVEWTNPITTINANSTFTAKIRLPLNKNSDTFHGFIELEFDTIDVVVIEVWGIRYVGVLELDRYSEALGNFDTAQLISVDIINNKPTSDTINSYTYTPDDGVSVFLPATGFVLNSLATTTMQINVSTSGNPNLNTVVKINFASGDTLSFTITGTRLSGEYIIDPTNKNLGYVKQNITFPFTLKNDHSVSKTLSIIYYQNVDGVTVNGITAGDIWGVGETKAGTVTVQNIGDDLIINGYIRFAFSDGNEAPLFITGTRGITFPFNPNERYTEGIKWNTEIFISDDGTEERYQLIDIKKRFFQMTFDFANKVFTRIQNSIEKGIDGVFLIPCWKDRSLTTSDTAIGANTVNCDTSYSDFEPLIDNNLVFIINGIAGEFGLYPINTVNPANITLTSTTDKFFPVGSVIVPAVYCSIDKSVNYVYDEFGNCKSMSVRFDEVV